MSALASVVSKMSVEQILNNINIIVAENPRSFKRYIVCASKFEDSIQSLMFNRLVELFGKEDSIELKGMTLVKQTSHGENKQIYIGIIDL